MPRNCKYKISAAHSNARQFNSKVQPGTPVWFWSGVKAGRPPTGRSVTITRALVSTGYSGVIIKGVRGVFPLSRIEVIKQDSQAVKKTA